MKTDIFIRRQKIWLIKVWIYLMGILVLGAMTNVKGYSQEKNTMTKERQLIIMVHLQIS
jgi:hypothetical protein